jgi:glycosyltransferase involved in cell wall biosynthesis
MNGYAAVHQFHSGTSTGDAITQQMFFLQQCLHGMGITSEVFAEHVDPHLQKRIRPICSYDGSDRALLLWHHSIGIDAFDQVAALPNDVVTIYHNVTPEQYFTDERLRRYLRMGREQLALLARRAKVGVADSNYNRREMLAVGFRRVEVLPPRVDFMDFYQQKDTPRSTDWIYVGRVVGNKCQHHLVHAFWTYTKTFGDADARLALIGDTSVADYCAFVRQQAERLGISDRVDLYGKVSDRDLKSALSRSGVFVSVSEHEGFGVPILEAMAARLPVVAYGAAAIPETMGGAGILLRTKDPSVVAATVQALVEDADLRLRIVDRQLRRVEQVQEFDTARLLGRVIGRASGAQPPLEVQVQGPFETSYSLAMMNRKLAVELDHFGDRALSIYCTEGPGDYEPAGEDLDRNPTATALFRRSRSIPYPDVVIRQMYPPRVADSPGAITCQYFGWEESRIPEAMAQDFNRYLDGIGAMSEFVLHVLRDSGVDVPIRVVGNGVEPHDPAAALVAPELDHVRSFCFLHIGSAFPRKGVDVLLDAFFSEFDDRDDVTLVLKTFPNPHNEMGHLLKRLQARHPNPPDVRWINRDLDERELQGLYNLAHCYVHPARGEGFGLPVAEAMLAQVPVIAVEYSGMADFVCPETAMTIPFCLEPARTHLGVPGSMWAEPSREVLAEEMRRMTQAADSAETLSKVERARNLISTRFSWEEAARRWDAFLDDLEDAAEIVRVAMVTTWNSRCGVAENSRYIVCYAPDSVDIAVFADTRSEVIDPASESGVVRCWSDRWNPDLGELEDALLASQPDVVHIQFNFGFFELAHLAGLIDRQLERSAVVVTLHRTKDIEIDRTTVSLASIRSTLERVDRLIVHQETDAHLLASLGLVKNVVVVPLGSLPPPDISPVEVRNALRLGNRPIIGTFGFLLPHKGTLDLLEVVAHLRTTMPDICLLALCARHPDPSSAEYEKKVRAEIEARALQENVLLITDYLPDDVARAVLRGVDAIVLPYQETEESSSAVLRFVLPLERPVITTDLAIFADSREALRVVDTADPLKISEVVGSILRDAECRDELASRASKAARRYRWQRVAADHREIYAMARAASRARAHCRATNR